MRLKRRELGAQGACRGPLLLVEQSFVVLDSCWIQMPCPLLLHVAFANPTEPTGDIPFHICTENMGRAIHGNEAGHFPRPPQPSNLSMMRGDVLSGNPTAWAVTNKIHLGAYRRPLSLDQWYRAQARVLVLERY